jgi:hypothetical protein
MNKYISYKQQRERALNGNVHANICERRNIKQQSFIEIFAASGIKIVFSMFLLQWKN